jgi:hypothetical protein
MKRSQVALIGLVVGFLIYGISALFAIGRLLQTSGNPRDLISAALPVTMSLLFGIAAVVVYRRSFGRRS